MGAGGQFDLDHALDAYFATLRSSALRKVLQRSAEHWPVYAAVTGSAMAMATSASAAILAAGTRSTPVAPAASVLPGKPQFASTQNLPLVVRSAIARQRAREGRTPGPGALIDRAAQEQPPVIAPGGVVPIYGTESIIQPGEWVTIYGSHLANTTALWNGDFPISLGGTKVEIDGRPAYLMYVSPDQINLQAPDDTAAGTVSVVVTTAAGSAASTVTLNQFAPSFCLFEMPDGKTGFVAGIILRSNHSGAYGGGTYDILGPTGDVLGYSTVAAQPGDTVELYGVGFGPTTPAVPAGKAFSGSAPVDDGVTVYINNVGVKPTFVGISSAGLYQINLVVPSGLGDGEVPIMAMAGGMQTEPNVLFPVAGPIVPVGSTIFSTFPGGSGGPPGGFGGGSFGGSGGGGWSGGGGGSGGGSGGGGSGGGSVVPTHHHKKKHYRPRLQFPPK